MIYYKTYAGKLMANLHEAIRIAQQHARKEQQHQAAGYNKRVHGTCLNANDRVLLANKAERGKRKLAYKWEPTIYTVMDRNPQTHIYKVMDESGSTKVVHRNLMLDVSFLPFPEQTSGELDSDASDEVSELQPLSIDILSDLAVAVSEDRTRSWICWSPDVDESLGDGIESGMEDKTPHHPSSGSDQPTPDPSQILPVMMRRKKRERKPYL